MSTKKYTAKERCEIHLKAQCMLGLVKKDKQDFMDECMAMLLDSGDAEDEADAEAQCEIIWEETGGDF